MVNAKWTELTLDQYNLLTADQIIKVDITPLWEKGTVLVLMPIVSLVK